MRRNVFVIVMMMALVVVSAFGQTRTGAKAAQKGKPVASKAIAAVINFNGGEDIAKLAVDSKNVYVAMKYTKRMAIIDKTSGKITEVKADHEISDVAVAADKCYYYVDQEGIFRYDAASGATEGPLFGYQPEDWYAPEKLNASPDGRFLLCGEYLIDVPAGRIVSKPGSGSAVNNMGGVYIMSPEAYYVPFGEGSYKVTPVGTAVGQFYLDEVTGNVIYCMSDGLAVSPMVPQPGVGVKKVATSFENEYNQASFITRDDEGNFVVTTNLEGIGFGGKSLEDPFRMENKISTGVKDQWGYSEIEYSGGGQYIVPDGNGNIVFGSEAYACVLIYNPKGVNGYTELKGKATRFE